METTAYYITPDIMATSGQRFANYIIDFVVQYALLFGAAIAALFIGDLTNNYVVNDYVANMDKLDEYLVGFIMTIIYYGLMETFLARSIGKYITKTVVVMEDGSKPDALTILKRTFSRIIPFDVLSFLGARARGWHDTISRTYVVKKELLDQRMHLHYSFAEIGHSASE